MQPSVLTFFSVAKPINVHEGIGIERGSEAREINSIPEVSIKLHYASVFTNLLTVLIPRFLKWARARHQYRIRSARSVITQILWMTW
jgi:hypothetical protein